MKPTLAIALLGLLRVCGSEDAPPPPAASGPASISAEATVAVPAPPTLSATVTAPRHGGTVVVAEDHAVEVVAVPSGEVYAYVVDAQGQVPPAAEVNLTVSVHGSDGALHPAVLVWSPVELRYVGRVSVTPVAGDVDVILVRGGRPRRGHLETYVVVTAPPPPRGRVDVEVHAPAPHGVVEVHGPEVRAGVDVRIVAPPPPRLDVQIGFGVPQPRGVVVVGGGARGNVEVRGRRHDNGWHKGHGRHRGRGR